MNTITVKIADRVREGTKGTDLTLVRLDLNQHQIVDLSLKLQ